MWSLAMASFQQHYDENIGCNFLEKKISASKWKRNFAKKV